MQYFLAFVFYVVIIYVVYRGFQSRKVFKAMGYLPENKIALGSYVSGHPNINNTMPMISIYAKKGNLEIFVPNFISTPKRIADIEIKLIKDVTTSDRSPHRVNKQKKLAYVIIKWHDGTFPHKTTFEIAGSNALEKANIARNQILKIIKEYA